MSDQTPDPILDPFRAKMERELIKYIVGRQITCMRSGEILDYRTCVVLRDADGDPSMVLSQSGWKSLVAINPETITERLASVNLTVDESTIKP